ncbi:galectin-3-like isoform X2 [Heterodontus francisci]|uniref:galectin-3-like isoform X2 n=1 Tax=Heterodontus francisci TaxID=7792 RepID=UPI00355B8416
MLEDALDVDSSSAAKLNAGGTNPQPVWPAPQPGSWPGYNPYAPPGQPGPYAPPGQPGPYAPPGQPGPYAPPGQPGPYAPPGQPGPYAPPGQPGPYAPPGQPGPYAPPMPAPFRSPGAPNQPGQKDPVLPVPYELAIPGGWTPQKMIKIIGTVKKNVDKFAFDIHCGQDIAFHFNVRFREDGYQQVIVRNCKINNAWGGEERAAPKFPFKQEERFEILILGESNQYRVAVNNQHLLEFRHRYKTLKDVTKVSIYGDITLHAMFMM